MTDGRFRFDADLHEYFDLETGDIIPHITGLLEVAGETNPEWYTDDSSERGTAVHKLTADFDLGALDLEGCVSRYRGYLLGYVEAMKLVPHEWDMVEEPLVSRRFRFGGRPDRGGRMWKAMSALEVKSGAPEKAHGIQLALQAILIGEETKLPAESIQRYACYVTAEGRGRVIEYPNRADFDRAYQILKKYAA